MLRLTSRKTLPILLYALDKIRFTQSEIRDKTGISIGRVNRIVKFLLDRGIVIKENARYVLLQPNRLSELIAGSYAVKEYLTFYLDLDKVKLLRLLRKFNATLCLDSALESFMKIESPTLHVYGGGGAELIKELNKIERGSTKLIIYKMPYEIEFTKENSKILAVIDLIAAGRAEQAKLLAEKIWDTKQ